MENKELALSVEEKPKLSTAAHLMAGWPLFLVMIGGAIGGALAVVAYVINRKIYLSQLSNMQKVLLIYSVVCPRSVCGGLLQRGCKAIWGLKRSEMMV
jgi:hypothetical protein